MYCIIVKTVIKDGAKGAFEAAININAAASVTNEEHCFVFDVIASVEEKNTYYLYEIYESADALEAHKQAAHYKECRAIVSDLIEEQSAMRGDVLATNSSL